MKLYGVIGWKNAGKTSLMERLVAHITARGFSVSTVKHVHHDVDLDQPGKDTFRHRAAGASEVVLASAHRFAILHEHRGPEPDLSAVLARMAPVDLVLVEGYKRDSHAKVEVFREGEGRSLIAPGDLTVRAVATDAAVDVAVPVLDLNDTAAVADFILREAGLVPVSQAVPAAPHVPRGKGGEAAFDTVMIADWSSSKELSSKKESENAIWIGVVRDGNTSTTYLRGRAEAETFIQNFLDSEEREGRRTLLGFDFAMAYPAGFARLLTGRADPRAVWHWLDQHIVDNPDNSNNRLDVAARINLQLGGRGPFWVVNEGLSQPGLPFGKIGKIDLPALGLSNMRAIEASGLAGKPTSVWQLTGPGAVGSQSLVGLPLVHRLSQRNGATVWPFEAPTGRLVIAEVYPSLLARSVAASGDDIKDRAQVRLLARALWQLGSKGQLPPLFDTPPEAQEEGWILGAGHAALLEQALTWA